MNKTQISKALLESKKRIYAYDKFITETEKEFRELNSENMQGTLIQIEDYLDSNHIYAFTNWIEGIIWEGPDVKRYWIEIILKYDFNKMPDPKGALRLVNSGTTVIYKKSTEYVLRDVQKTADLDPMTQKPKEDKKEIWLVFLKIPRHFIENAIEDFNDGQEEPAQEDDQADQEEPTTKEDDIFSDDNNEEEELDL